MYEIYYNETCSLLDHAQYFLVVRSYKRDYLLALHM